MTIQDITDLAKLLDHERDNATLSAFFLIQSSKTYSLHKVNIANGIDDDIKNNVFDDLNGIFLTNHSIPLTLVSQCTPDATGLLYYDLPTPPASLGSVLSFDFDKVLSTS